MYSDGMKGWIKHIDFILFDVICMLVSFTIAYHLRIQGSLVTDELYNDLFLLLLFLDLFVCILSNNYSCVLRRGHLSEFVDTLKHAGMVAGMLIIVLFIKHKDIGSYSRQVLITLPIFYVVISFEVRMLWKWYIKHHLRANRNRSLVVVTHFDGADKLVHNIKHKDFNQYLIRGIFTLEPGHKGETICDIPVIDVADKVIERVQSEWVDEVLISVPATEPIPEILLEKLNQMGIVVHINLNRTVGQSTMQQSVGQIGDNCVLTYSVRRVSNSQLVCKRLLDIFGGLIGCLVTGILTIILAPIIFIKSPGPIFFVQTRIGKNGKKFKIAKFRSMYMDAEERKAQLMAENKISDGKMFKMDEDPRIIGSKILPDGTYKKGIGNFIRDFSLDEFPQFWNVLIGQMSIVGTRPPVEQEWVLYSPENRGRLAVKPGITGLWQVSGRSNITDFDEVVKLDSEYINTWTVGKDLKIILATVGVVLKRDGAV